MKMGECLGTSRMALTTPAPRRLNPTRLGTLSAASLTATTGPSSFAGGVTVGSGGLTVTSGGINLNGGGIANAGAITGITSVAASGTSYQRGMMVRCVG